jgi:hypothetical protein
MHISAEVIMLYECLGFVHKHSAVHDAYFLHYETPYTSHTHFLETNLFS